MENEKKRWYKKKRYIGGIVIVVFLVILGSGNNQQSNQANPQTITPTYNSYNVQSSYQSVTPTVNTNNLSNDNYYTNTSGNEVHSPAYSNSVPIGASARCGDGTYSFSQSRRGTCSHHGGVAEWL
jgi:hypothetical protein